MSIAADTAGIEPDRLVALLERVRHEVEGPGALLPAAQVAVARDGRVVASGTFGAPPGHRFVVFSVTKAIVASVVWLLIGDGLLDPEAPVAEVVPELATNGKDAITTAHLLTHTAGIPHAPLGPPDWFDRAHRLERFARWRLNWEPGTRMEYHATSAHWVLAEVVDRVTGGDYREVVRTRVAEPLGLPSLRLGVPDGAQDDVVRPVVVGQPPTPDELAAVGAPAVDLREIAGDVLERYADPETVALGVPGAGAVSTADDVARFYQALLHDRGGLWDPAVLADATRNVRVRFPDPMTGLPANRTLGLVVAGDDGGAATRGMPRTASPRTFGHHGVGGQAAWADPDSGISMCFLTCGLDAHVLREGRRRAAIGNRAGALAAG